MSRLCWDKKVIGADQEHAFMESLRAHTYEAAYAAHDEKMNGSIEAGKYADIIIWPKDPRSLAGAESLGAIKSMHMTIIGGKIVHQDA